MVLGVIEEYKLFIVVNMLIIKAYLFCVLSVGGALTNEKGFVSVDILL